LLGKVRREFGNFFVGISAAQTFDLKSLCGLHQRSQVGLGNTNLTPERKYWNLNLFKKYFFHFTSKSFLTRNILGQTKMLRVIKLAVR
jgi:hypothetical protein